MQRLHESCCEAAIQLAVPKAQLYEAVSMLVQHKTDCAVTCNVQCACRVQERMSASKLGPWLQLLFRSFGKLMEKVYKDDPMEL